MKTLLLLIAVSFTAAHWIRHSAYEPETEYVYMYESQVITGVPHHGVEYSGIKIKAVVRMQVKTDNRVILKLSEDTTVKKMMTAVSIPWPLSGRLLPETIFTSVEEPTIREMKEQLTKPITFRFNDGKIENIKMEAEEPTWSVNIKKGLLETLKVNLNRAERIEEELNEEWKGRIEDEYERIYSEAESDEVYRVMEAGVSGICETIYAVKPSERLREPTLKVTKVKNFKNCVVEPVLEQGLISGLTITPATFASKDVIQKSSHADIEVIGTRDKFLVETVRQNSKYILTPMKEKHGSAVTAITQHLTLLETKAVERTIVSSAPLRLKTKGLIYEFSEETPFTKPMTFEFERLNMELEGAPTEEKVRMVDTLLSEAVTEIHTKVDFKGIDKLKRIECVLNSMSEEELKTICEKVIRSSKGSETEEKKAEILLDILPTMTHTKVVPVVAHLITNRMITTTRAIITMKLVALTVTPDITTVTFLRPSNTAFFASETVRSNPVLKRNLVLAFGTIARRAVKHLINMGVPKPTVMARLSVPVSEVIEMIKKESDTKFKSAAIRSLANTGCPAFIPLLKEIAQDKSESVIVRTNAIMAFPKQEDAFKPKVEAVLSSIYMDYTEEPEVRVPAFIALMDIKPRPGTLQLIARVQRKEKSIQVGSMVYSYLSTIAKADLPGMTNLSAEVRHIIPLVRAIAPNTIGDAKGVYLDYMCEYSNVGTGFEIFKTNGPRDVLPSAMMARLSLHALGKTFTAVSAGAYAKGVQPILNKILGTHRSFMGSFGDKPIKEIINNILRPLQSGNVDLGTVAVEIKEIIEKLGIVERPVLEKLNLGFYMNLLGNEVTFLDITAEDIISFIETGEIPIIGNVKELITEITAGKTLDILKVLHVGTSSLEVPTPAGIPVFVNLTATAITHLHGDISMRGTNVVDMFNYGIYGHLPTEAAVHAYLKPRMAMEITASMGATVGLIKAGVAIRIAQASDLPVTTTIKLNTDTGKLKTTIELPTQETEVMKVRVVPEVFVIIANPNVEILNKKMERMTLTHPYQMESVAIRVPVDVAFINTRVKVFTELPKTLPAYKPASYIWGKKELVIALEPMESSNPIEIEVELTSKLTNYRTIDRESMLLEDVEINPMITGPRVVKAAVSMGTRGNRKAAIAVNVVMSENLWLHQINTRVVLPTNQIGPISAQLFVNLNTMTTRPSIMEALSPTTTAAELKVTVGSATAFQIKVVPHTGTPVTWDKWTKNVFFRALETVAENPVTVTKEETLAETPRAVTYKVIVEGSNVNWNKVETIGLSLITLATSRLDIPNILGAPVIDAKEAESPAGVGIEGLITILPKFRKAIVVLKTPREMEYSIEVPVYMWAPWYKTISLETPILVGESQMYDEEELSDWIRIPKKYRPEGIAEDDEILRIPERYWSEDMMESLRIPERSPIEMEFGTCAIHRPTGMGIDAVTTFDSMTYTFPKPPSECEVVLAKDCSALSLFTVLMTPVEDTKIIKILVPRKKIEIVPVNGIWMSSSALKVKINGETLPIMDGQVKEITEIGASTRVIGEVTKDDNWVTVRVTSVGIVVATDGKKVVVKTNPLMRSYTCGLCGNYNDEMEDDLEGPDMFMSRTNKVMISKYVVPSGACPIDSVRTKYDISDIEDTCEPVERTIVLERDETTCFSTTPVPVCSRSCRPAGRVVRRESIPVYCRNTNNYTTRRYIQDAQERVLEEIAFKSATKTVSVEVPTRCVPVY